MNDKSAEILTKYGFSVATGYSSLVKVYSIGKRQIILKPFFDKSGNINSLTIIDTKRKKQISLKSSDNIHTALKDVPVICLNTVIDLVADTFGINVPKRNPQYIINAVCSVCNRSSPSFIVLKQAVICNNCSVQNKL